MLIFILAISCLTTSAAAAAAKSLQSCPTVCNPIDGSPLGSAVPGILQARTLLCISFSNAWKWKVKVKSLSHVQLSVTPYQVPLSMGFSRQEYWSGVPLPSPLTTSNLPLFMNLTFQVPMQYFSLQHWTLLSPPDTPTIEHYFCFGQTTSFFLKLLVIALCSSSVVCRTHSDLGDSLFCVISFIQFM